MTTDSTSNITPPDGAKDFLLQEYQSLNKLFHATKAASEARLNFYVGFLTVIATFTATIRDSNFHWTALHSYRSACRVYYHSCAYD